MERTAGEVISRCFLIWTAAIIRLMLMIILDGDGSLLETEMFAKYPHSPTDSSPATPGGPRRRIRCKMCRFAVFHPFYLHMIINFVDKH